MYVNPNLIELDRATFAVKSMESTDTLAITYKVDID